MKDLTAMPLTDTDPCVCLCVCVHVHGGLQVHDVICQHQQLAADSHAW